MDCLPTLFLCINQKSNRIMQGMNSRAIKQEDMYGERKNLSYFGRIEKG